MKIFILSLLTLNSSLTCISLHTRCATSSPTPGAIPPSTTPSSPFATSKTHRRTSSPPGYRPTMATLKRAPPSTRPDHRPSISHLQTRMIMGCQRMGIYRAICIGASMIGRGQFVFNFFQSRILVFRSKSLTIFKY